MSAYRPRSSPFRSEEDFYGSVAALIDVGFLLLIYFLVTTTLVKQEADLDMKLPGVSRISSAPIRIDQLRIEVLSGGEILVNGQPTGDGLQESSVPNLFDTLDRYAAAAQLAGWKPVVVVQSDDNVVEQRFMDVLNACTRAKIENVSLSF